MYVDDVRDGADQNIEDLLDGLEGAARTERAELVEWLLAQGITREEIRSTNPPLLLATRHLIGDDGSYVSAREISETHGIELELLQQVQRAIGLARVGDADAVIHMRADGEAAAFTQEFVELGLNPEQMLLVVRVLASRLAVVARDMAVPPVRFIKTIGDAVMFVCPDPLPLLDVVVKLVEVVDTDNDFPRLRAGVASGMAVSRAGDWFGSPVNVASRVTGVARPGTVLVADSVWDVVGDSGRFDGSFAGARRLKGIKNEAKLFRIRRGDGGADR